jgi:hypothetical protein
VDTVGKDSAYTGDMQVEYIFECENRHRKDFYVWWAAIILNVIWTETDIIWLYNLMLQRSDRGG